MRTAIVVVLSALSCGWAAANDVVFRGDVIAICSILVSTDGTLGINTDGDEISSTGTLGGLPGTVTILSIGPNTIDVSAPELTDEPGDYDDTNQVVEVSYEGIDTGLSGISQTWTSADSDFDLTGAISASVLEVNTRVRNEDGFAAGHYEITTEVTCEP